MKTVAVDHAVLTLRLVGNPSAPNHSRELLESMSDQDFVNYISDVGATYGSHTLVEVNEVLRRKLLGGWELFAVIPVRTSFNQDQAATSATTEYVFVRQEGETEIKKAK